MVTPIATMMPEIVHLIRPDRAYSYYAQGNVITGWWDVRKSELLHPESISNLDQAYRIRVTLDEPTGTFDYGETWTSFWGDGYRGDGPLIRNNHRRSGKRIEKSVSFTFGKGRTNNSESESQNPNPRRYFFPNGDLKRPLFEWLEHHGWQHQTETGRFFAR